MCRGGFMAKSDLTTLCASFSAHFLWSVQVASTLRGVRKKRQINYFVKSLWFDYQWGTFSGGWSTCKLENLRPLVSHMSLCVCAKIWRKPSQQIKRRPMYRVTCAKTALRHTQHSTQEFDKFHVMSYMTFYDVEWRDRQKSSIFLQNDEINPANIVRITSCLRCQSWKQSFHDVMSRQKQSHDSQGVIEKLF